MNFLHKTVGLFAAALFFVVTVSAGSYIVMDATGDSTFFHTAQTVLGAYYQNYKLNYLNYYPKFDVYGNIEYFPTISYTYFFPFTGFVPVQKTFPPASIRNTQAIEIEKREESEFLINAEKFKSSTSTLRVVPKKTEPVINAGSSQAQIPNKLFFAAQQSEPACSFLGIISDSIDVKAGESATKHLFIKNTASEDFFVESVTVEENSQIISAGISVLDQKILENNLGRASITVNAARAETDSVEKIKVIASGKFVSGKNCGVEKEFLVGVQGEKKTTAVQNYALSVPEKIEVEESGFAAISLNNQTDNEIKITISSDKGAIIHPNAITVPNHYFMERVVSINQATDGEFVYYTLSSGGSFLVQKYSKIVFPKIPQKEPVDFGPIGGTIVIESYTSKATFIDGTAEIGVSLENGTASDKKLTFRLVNPPYGIEFAGATAIIGAGKTESYYFTVHDFGVQSFPANAVLQVMFGEKTLSRQIVFEKNQTAPQAQEQISRQERGIGGIVQAGLLTLQKNTLAIAGAVLLLVATIFLALIFSSKSKIQAQPWIANNLR